MLSHAVQSAAVLSVQELGLHVEAQLESTLGTCLSFCCFRYEQTCKPNAAGKGDRKTKAPPPRLCLAIGLDLEDISKRRTHDASVSEMQSLGIDPWWKSPAPRATESPANEFRRTSANIRPQATPREMSPGHAPPRRQLQERPRSLWPSWNPDFPNAERVGHTGDSRCTTSRPSESSLALLYVLPRCPKTGQGSSSGGKDHLPGSPESGNG